MRKKKTINKHLRNAIKCMLVIFFYLIAFYTPHAYSDEDASQPTPYDSDNAGVSKDDENDGFMNDQETDLYSG